MGNWLKKNAINLIIVAAFAVIIYLLAFRGTTPSEGLSKLWNWFLVAFGIGFLIFIHELGHFLAAKACNVKVETFSVGFGPPIPGCHFRRGETLYKLAWFPLGGYVKMAGEYPNEQTDDEIKNDPRSFMNKTVGQRMIIISAGVVFNVILGMICFSYVYLAGRSQIAPAVSYVEPGSPAALAGLEAGSTIKVIDNDTNPTFEDLVFATLLARPGVTQIHMNWVTPDGTEREGTLIPRRLGDDIKPVIGAGFPTSLNVIDPGKKDVPVSIPNTPAAAAEFKPGDKLVAVRKNKDDEPILLKNGWHYSSLEGRSRGQPIIVTVKRGEETVDVPLGPRWFWSYGLRMEPGAIVAVEKPEDRPPSARGLEVGDVIVGLNGDRTFDAIRLPDLIWEKAQKREPIKLTTLRGNKEIEFDINPEEIANRGTWEEQAPNNLLSPLSIPALGVAYAAKPVLRGVDPNSPAEKAKLKAGDTIKAVIFDDPVTEQRKKKKTIAIGWIQMPEFKLVENQWPAVFFRLQSGKSETLQLVVADSSGKEREVELASVEDATWAYPNRGLRREYERRELQASGVGEAIALGFRDTYRNIARLYMSLNSIIMGYVSAKDSLSGPIGLLDQTYKMAEQGTTELVFIIGFISVNLAVVNFLPIPVLDGGHMVFLIVEKLRGKPASERVLVIANVVGLVLILSLMLTVIVLDLRKFGLLEFMGL